VSVCPVCKGNKTLPADEPDVLPDECWGCDGTGEEPAPVEAPAPPPIDVDPLQCPACGDRVAAPGELVTHGLEKHADQLRKGAGEVADPPRRRRRQARVAEARPWEAENSDHTLNAGSYAASAVVGFAEWAYRLILDHHDEVGEVGAPTPAPAPQVRALARQLLRATDIVQARARADGYVDRMARSHTVARGAVRNALRAHPVPWGASDEEKAAWVRALAHTASELVSVGLSLIDREPLEEGDLDG
jgi:hypothetical protein